MHKFCEKKLQNFCKQPVKGNLHNFSFSWLKIRLFKILQKFLHIWNGMVKGFSKMYNFSFFGQIYFCKHFCYITGFCDKNSIFANLQFFLQILKEEHKSFLMMYICHIWTSNMGFRGVGVKLIPPSISWFSSTPAEIGLSSQTRSNSERVNA